MCGNYGFEFFSFGARAPFPLTAPKYHSCPSYPGEWKSRYISGRLHIIDPIVRHGLLGIHPADLEWRRLSRENRFFWRSAASRHPSRAGRFPVRGKYGLTACCPWVRSSEKHRARHGNPGEGNPSCSGSPACCSYLAATCWRAHRPGSNVRPDRQGNRGCSSGTAVGQDLREIGLILRSTSAR
ncbi:autoinducer binding domain-containing protein [Pseudomonas aeruginosa]|uniref:autoinducer binding domain-containing protein n=1 Tax=Pseudomonas aeruginosa TaxID=287 RepID=UPI0039B000A2